MIRLMEAVLDKEAHARNEEITVPCTVFDRSVVELLECALT